MVLDLMRSRSTLVASALVLGSFVASANAQRAGDPLRVFTKVVHQEAQGSGDPGVLRRNYVDSRLSEVLGEDTLVLDLFDDVSVLAQREGARQPWESPGSWVGRVESELGGDVTLVEKDGVVVGTVRVGNRVIKVRHVDGAVHAIEEVDASAYPQCATSPAHKVVASEADVLGSVSPSAPTAVDVQGFPTIDVLVAYTPAAKSSAGGQAAIEATIELAVLEANQAYANSGIGYRLRLAKAVEIAYTEVASFNEMLGRLRNPSDGHMDEVHALRDMYGADMVSLIVAGSQYCGLGYLMTSPGPGFESWAFSVVARGCATGFYSFAHELGHNLGCQHDVDHGGAGAYAFSYGHRNSNAAWRTIMAYAPGTRIKHFSNPSVSYNGEATGLVPTSAPGADNAMTINMTAPIVADFRDAPVYAFGNAKQTSLGELPSLTWSGSPGVEANQFRLELGNAVPRTFGLLLRGAVYSPHPFHGGTLYFSSPFHRMGPVQANLQGDATRTVDIASSTPGTTDYYQVVFRDPLHPDGTGIGVTNPVKVTYLP